MYTPTSRPSDTLVNMVNLDRARPVESRSTDVSKAFRMQKATGMTNLVLSRDQRDLYSKYQMKDRADVDLSGLSGRSAICVRRGCLLCIVALGYDIEPSRLGEPKVVQVVAKIQSASRARTAKIRIYKTPL